MNSFPPHSSNLFGSCITIESDTWCDSIHARNCNQHGLNKFLCEDKKATNDPHSASEVNDLRKKYQLHSKEYKPKEDYKPTEDDKLTMELCPFNDFEFNQDASGLGLLHIENMTESLTTQLIFPNTIANGARTCLGTDFIPSNYNVICGRGKRAYNHVGNRRFKLIIAMNLRKYVDTNNLTKKSEVVDAVINQIREATGSATGTGFLKVDSAGNWYDVGIEEAREKTSRAFRDYSTTGSLGLKRENDNWSTSWDDERKKRIMTIQNTIFKSCQIKFSGQYNNRDTRSRS